MKGCLIVFGIIAVVILLTLLEAWIFMLLWNWIMPLVFGFTTFTFIQSFVIIIIFNLILSLIRTGGNNG